MTKARGRNCDGGSQAVCGLGVRGVLYQFHVDEKARACGELNVANGRSGTSVEFARVASH